MELKDQDLATGLTMMGALLDHEWTMATGDFKGNPSTENWMRLHRIMHVRQLWAGKDLNERYAALRGLMDKGIGHWVGALYIERVEDLKRHKSRLMEDGDVALAPKGKTRPTLR